MIGASYYIFLFSVSIGSKASDIWLTQSLISLTENIFLLQPIKIYIKWILLASAVTSIQVWHKLLRDRSTNIMKRKTGLIFDSNALIQRFNPSCRVARQCPHLSSSRLLMSLNDFDLPVQYILQPNYAISTIMIVATAIIISTLPEFIRDASIDSLIRPNLNGLFIGIIYLSHISIGIPIAIGIVSLLFIVLYTYYQNSKNKKQSNMVTPVSVTISSYDTALKMSIATENTEKKLIETERKMGMTNYERNNIQKIKEKQRKFNAILPNDK